MAKNLTKQAELNRFIRLVQVSVQNKGFISISRRAPLGTLKIRLDIAESIL